MEGLDKAGCRQEAPASSHEAREDGRPLRAWTTPVGRTQAHQREDSAARLQSDASGTLGFSDLSSSIADSNGITQSTFYELGASEQHQDTPEFGGLDKFLAEEMSGQGHLDQVLEEEEEERNGKSARKIPKQETVRMVGVQAARYISEILCAELLGGLQAALRKEIMGAELRGGLQAALREEVSQAVTEEFQRCFQELRELRPQRMLVESGCQADGSTIPVQLQPGHSLSDGNLPCATRASAPQSQTSSISPLAHTVATADRGQKLVLPKHGDEAHHHAACGDNVVSGVSSRPRPAAHHHNDFGDSLASGVSSRAQQTMRYLSCGDSFESCVSNSGQSMVGEEQSFISIRQKALFVLLQQQGLEKYAPDMTAPKRSPKTRTGPAARQSSGSRTRKPPPHEVSRRACLIGTDTREGDEGAGAKPPTRLSKKDRCELGVVKLKLASELFSTGDLLSPEDDGRNSCSSQDSKHTWVQDAGSHRRRDLQYTSTPTGEEGWHSSQTKQDSQCSFSGKRSQRPSTPEIPGWPSSETFMNSSEEILCQEKGVDTAKWADEAVHSDISSAGSLAQSASQRCKWSKLDPGLRVPTVQMLRVKRDEELVSQLSLDEGNGELDSVTPAAPRDESERRSWFVALATVIRFRLGSLVVPACAIIPWAPAYPWASAFYRWVILCLVGKAFYYSVSMAYKEWEMGESFGQVVLALDAIMGMGALMGILACGALCRSSVLVAGCNLLQAYARRAGVLTHWEGVSATDFFCTASFWIASVLTAALEPLHLRHRAAAEDLNLHVGFALCAFILMGLSQFVIHKCRCLSTMIDAFCYQIIKQQNFSEVLSEWILLEALCRSVCGSIQLAFLSLQATAMAVVMLSIQQVGWNDTARFLSLAPGLIVAAGVFRTSLWAAAVTDKFTRLPMLVNSLSGGSLLDQDRMYAVHYIAYSQAGFYVLDMRVTSTGVLRTVYIVCAATFLLFTRVFAE